MKRYEYTTYTCLMSLFFIGISLLSSCSDEVAVDTGEMTDGLPSLSIVANVDAGIVTRATDDPAKDTRNMKGSWIKNMTVFLFATDAADSATPLLTKTVQVDGNPTIANQANKIELAGQDLRKAGIEIGSHVAVYAIANVTLAEANKMTKQQVLAQTAALPQYRQSGALYDLVPMTGCVLDQEITSTTSQTIDLPLKRAVIRIKIDIVDAEFDNDKYASSLYYWKIESVKLYNDYATTYLWNEGIPANPGCRTVANGIGITPKSPDDYPLSNTFAAGTYYLNCNETSAAHTVSEPIKIKVSGSRGNGNGIDTPFEYTVDLKRTDNSYVFERNTSITATLTLNAGSATLKLSDMPWDEGNGLVSDAKPQPPKANSYIMKPGSSILIPVSQVQEAHAFHSSIPAISAGEELTAYLVWTDVKGATSGKGVADDASVASITMSGNGADALIRVTAGSEAGNSVIAVKTQKGIVKWSWHIWVTDYNPETDNITQGDYTFMDRNLGALTNQPDLTGSNSNGVVGNYYQWGRPTPLPTKGTGGTNGFIQTYDAKGSVISITSGTGTSSSPTVAAIDISDIIKTPYKAATGNYNTSRKQLWDPKAKTALDPCPPGWRMPGKAWEGTTFTAHTNADGTTVVGYDNGGGFYPISQFVMNGNVGGVMQFSIWTAEIQNTLNAYYYYNGKVYELKYEYGLTVRCIKE